MVTVMLPFFFMAMYEKDGLPFEKVVANIIRQKFICPAVRPYKTENFYQEISTPVSYTHLDVYKRQLLLQTPEKGGQGQWQITASITTSS